MNKEDPEMKDDKTKDGSAMATALAADPKLDPEEFEEAMAMALSTSKASND
jgi:hypothetical protein